MESMVDKLDIDKLKTVPADLKNLTGILEKEFEKN